MAVIDNLSASLKSFTIGENNSRFINCGGAYNTAEILNGGETYDEENSALNILSYVFTIKGLQDHTIKDVIVKSLLLTSSGELNSEKNFTFVVNNIRKTEDLTASETSKKIIPTTINFVETEEENSLELTIQVSNNSKKSCYYGMYGITLELQDIDYSVQLTFTGPNSGRNASAITVNSVLISKNAVAISFTKDQSTEFTSSDDIEGRVYFRRDGIYVDGYQYGTVAGATGIKAGIVKLKDSFDTFVDEDTGETGIVAPTEGGVAASTVMVFNALASAKEYTDELTNFSDDFERNEDNKKLYIKWVEINGSV